MRAPPLRRLVADSAKLVVLVVDVPAALSRRLWPNAVTGTYEMYGGQVDQSGLPKKLTLGSPKQTPGEDPA